MIQRGIQSILNSLHISRSLSHLHQNPNFISNPATSMDTDENCVDVINRPSRKHIATLHDVSHNVFKQTCSTKKRVALAEITNSGSVCSIPSSDSRRNVKQKKDQECVRSDLSVSFESARDDRPLMYQHLHLIEIEEKRRPLPNYMKKIQKDVTTGMREILVDWLVEVAEEYKLVSDTLFLTVSYIDRFLSSHCFSRNKLQLLGVSSMLLASKFEEVSPPHAEDYCYITDNTYTKEEVVQMEKDLLNFLELELSNPTPKTFVRIFIRAAQGDIMPSNSAFEFLSWFLVELSLLDYSCLRFLPSMVAASAVFIANFTIQPEKHPWGLKMQRYSGYRPCELKDCVIAIHDLQLRRTSSFSQATREKYSQQKFKCVAALLSPPVIPVSYFEDADE
ncbi:putative cyclin [Helianthus annuus]|uniref:Cyclin n=2 Tax=Helianthus annuus TaxID=4232 RepID=A0A9K3N4R2_HELAN|nr:putative cyclin-A3-1 isoform X2 [Helianthus annuus]KAF5786892.1 putative cyclin [Helianthus annuus]